jgi:glycosyltransferase involved in cell wall biosynthesis
MRILSITAGAPGMYCGTCLRDNSLARALIADGHDVLLVPIYTPTHTDEPNVSRPRVFFGGVSVYLEQYVSLFRKLPAALDRLWDATPVLRALAARSIPADPKMLGELTVSVLRGEDGFQRKEIDKLVSWLRTEPTPDVIDLSNSLMIGLAAPLKRALGRPVCCTLQGEDLFLDGLSEPYRSQAMTLIAEHASHVDRFIAVSDYYAAFMRDYLRIAPDKIRLVPLGINVDGYDPRPRPRTPPFKIGYFARIAPEKGLHHLCEAYRLLRQELGMPPSRFEAAGSLSAQHKPYLEDLRTRLHDWGLDGEFVYHGMLDRAGKIAFLQSMDVISVPSAYDEPKGIHVLEALAAATPVVQPDRGAFPEILRKTGGGLLVPPDDPRAVAEAILRLYRDPGLGVRLAEEGARGVRAHYTAAQMARRAVDVYGEVLNLPSRAEHTLTAARP